jgi:hypothetical protein
MTKAVARSALIFMTSFRSGSQLRWIVGTTIGVAALAVAAAKLLP